ncbi:MAG: hypothetical protein H6865_01060 [Rhodospirillales bacterium]|nr:hypothetical protein [Rhodospirillales bacterium]USO08654.1 MAG: hypothetical protein H6866_07310 [Rhodospirillales bacterium]
MSYFNFRRDPCGHENFPVVQLEDEMKKSYLDYAMSVIVSRALPDARRRVEAGPSPHPVRDQYKIYDTR